MYCDQCGIELADGSRFCPECGAQKQANVTSQQQFSGQRKKTHVSKPTKIFIGIASILPLFYMFFFMATILSDMFSHSPIIPLNVLFGIHMLTIFYMLISIALYIIHLFRNDMVKSDYKVLWAFVLFMGGMIAMPIYWYLYIWKEPEIKKT